MAMLAEAVDSGSLSAVSRKMNVPLPTVSWKIADLELHLGTRLLIRSTRKLVLTEAGAAYVSVAKKSWNRSLRLNEQLRASTARREEILP